MSHSLRQTAVAAILLLSATTARSSTLAFSEAWQQLQRSNPGLQAARTEVERRAVERMATRSLRQPQIDVTATQTWINDPIIINLDPIRSAMLRLHPSVPSSAVPPFVTTVQDDSFLKGQLTASWPLYSGGRISAARRASEAAVVETRAALRQTENTLFTELVRRYYGLQLARVVQATRTAVLEGVEEHLRQAVRLEQEGFITRAERLHADVARAEARREKQKADRLVEIAGIALAGLLAEADAPLPASPLFVVTAPLGRPDSFVTAGATHQPVLEALSAKRTQAAEGVKAEQGRLRPEVYWFGAKELNRGDLTLLDPDWATGIGVRFSIWDRTDRLSRVRAARMTARRVELIEEDTRRAVRTLIEKAHREAVSAQEQFASLEESLAVGRENLRVRQASFAEGQATSLEVVDARLSLARVETERAVAANDFVIALAVLLEASGQPSRFFEYEGRAEHRIAP